MLAKDNLAHEKKDLHNKCESLAYDYQRLLEADWNM